MTFTETLEYLRQINTLSIIIRLAAALLLGGLVGFERGKRGRAAGFRTHILVCIGACMATLTGQYVVSVLGMSSDPMRLGAQVISGIGFLGVGTIIITGKNQVRGLTTAAGLWSTATIGLALGIGFYEAAFICTLFILFTIVFLHKFDTVFFAKTADIDVYIEIDDMKNIKTVLNHIKSMDYDIHNINIIAPKSATEHHVGIEGIITSKRKWNKENVIDQITAVEGVIFITETT